MTIWQLAVIIGITLLALGLSVWLLFRPARKLRAVKKEFLLSDVVEKDVERVFDDEFREELKNRGRLHFEKIIGENAMFLQQDLRLTTSQLNDYMKNEIKKVLED